MLLEIQHKHLLIALNHQSSILNFLKNSVCTNLLHFRPSVGTLRHEPSDAHLLPAAFLPRVLQHVRHPRHNSGAHDTRRVLRVLQRRGRAARRAGWEVQRDTRRAHNVHRHAESPASRGVWPVDVARRRLRRGADAACGRATSRRKAPSSTDSGRVVFFVFVWSYHYLRVRVFFQSYHLINLNLVCIRRRTLISTKDID